MSRIAKQPIPLPSKTTASFDGVTLTITGPLGTLSRTFLSDIGVALTDNAVTLTLERKSNFARALWGTYASHVKNMVHGVNTKYEKKLLIEGVGYKADVSGKNVVMALGFSHPVIIPIPEGITVTAEKGSLTISGIDKELVGYFAAKIRDQKKPEPYKGKGIRYSDEVIRRKQGKRAA